MWKKLAVLLLLTFLVTTQADSPLFEAVQENSQEAVNKAIANGADVNQIGPEGQTPLLYAAALGHVQAAKALLKHDADYTIPETSTSYTIFDVAAINGNYAMVDFLALHKDKKRKYAIRLEMMKKKHIDGNYPLHRACLGKSGEHSKTVMAFLEFMPWNFKNDFGKTCKDLTPSKITEYALRHAAAEAGDEL